MLTYEFHATLMPERGSTPLTERNYNTRSFSASDNHPCQNVAIVLGFIELARWEHPASL